MASVDRNTSATTGAPQEKICRSDSMRLPVVPQYAPRFRQTAGDANACVTFQSFAAVSRFSGSAEAGREKSISGSTVVTPIAELNKANSGKHDRSPPPGWMPYVD